MNHREFQRIINTLADEIGGDGSTIASHNFPSEVYIRGPNEETFVITDIFLNQLGGCGCPCDIIIDVDYEE